VSGGRRGFRSRSLALACALSFSLSGAAEALRSAGDARLAALPFSDLAGWAADDHEAALAVFRRSCGQVVQDAPPLRTALPASDDLKRACAAALDPARSGTARMFFEDFFTPFEVTPPSGRGFLTGYFEPEYEGSLARTESFPTALLARPADLVAIPQGETWPGLEGLQAGRKTGSGHEPYPDRAAIEDGALGGEAKPLVFLRDPVEAFIIQVQGSARIRLPDGTTVRIAYAGKNGYPFTAPGRIIVERGHVPLAEMNLERLTSWLRANPEEGREIMRLNRSYVFFRLASELDEGDGPIGAAGVPLSAGRSLAVDRHLWSYGLPFWLEGELPCIGGSEPLARLLVAQDTGTAILGPARGDFYFGSGREAGIRAGLTRHPVRFIVLLPKAAGAP
jgi:membrane-bound lytic murein transglycosylase A